MSMETNLENIVLHNTPRVFRILNIMNKMTCTPQNIARNMHRLPRIHELLSKEYESLNAKLIETKEKLNYVEQESFTDQLTRAGNRRAYEVKGVEELQQAKRLGEGLTIVYFNLDHFKNINDTYGHPIGDYVLKTFTKAAQSSLRVGASLYRIGGEEFAIIARTKLSEAPIAAQTIAERVQDNYKELMIQTDIPKVIRDDINKPTFSVSAGFACYSQDVQHIFNYANIAAEELFKKLYTIADERLYHAKHTKRGSIVGIDYIPKAA